MAVMVRQTQLDAIREQTSKIEDLLNTVGEPMKPSVLYRTAK